MTEHPEDELASTEQLDELRSLLAPGEDLPDSMRAHEAAQRIVELRSTRKPA